MLFTFINGPLDGQLKEIALLSLTGDRFIHYEVLSHPDPYTLAPIIIMHYYEPDGPLMWYRGNK